jgi:hypothetical protein
MTPKAYQDTNPTQDKTQPFSQCHNRAAHIHQAGPSRHRQIPGDIPILSEKVHNKPASQLWFKPGGFGRHYISAIGYINKLLHGHRVKRECGPHLATIHPPFEFPKASETTDKINPGGCPEVLNIQDVIKHQG